MIHYDLRCGTGHIFDGWFRSSAAFDQQSADGLLDCPVCASADVSRAIMAPNVGRGAVAPKQNSAPASGQVAPLGGKQVAVSTPDAKPMAAQAEGTAVVPAAPALAGEIMSMQMPDQVRAVLQRIRAEIEQKCDYVGPRFAEAARAIHNGDTPARPIYGETTPDQAEALAEDGIEVSRIPWVPRADG